jgi:hypothetical protein
VVGTYNPNNWKAEARGLQVQGQPGLNSKTLSKKEEGRKEGREGGRGRRRKGKRERGKE